MARRNEEIYFSSLHPFSLYHNTTMPTISAKLKLKSLSVATPYTTHSEHEHGKHLCSSHLIFTFPQKSKNSTKATGGGRCAQLLANMWVLCNIMYVE